jgi:hypothetical protein
LLVATMKVSGLAPVPAGVNWRVNFTANAPGGVSDRGDQFWMRANTGNLATPVFDFGTAVRNSDGSLSYTSRGNADFGAFDTTNSTVTLKVALSKLNPFVTHGPPIAGGSVLYGLRGQAFTSGANAERDLTRGGTSYTVCRELLDAGPPALPAEFRLGRPVPNPSGGVATIELSLPSAAWTELAVFDEQGRRVRTVHAGPLPAGITRLRWDGHTDRGRLAGTGVYFVRMNAGGKVSSRRMVLIR